MENVKKVRLTFSSFWSGGEEHAMKLAVACLGILGFAGVAFAAPELLITKPPVVSGSDPDTGPAVDPTASQGQWFTGATTGGLPTGSQFSIPIQFYDNPETPVNTVNGGGGSDGTNAITGVVNSVTFNGANISAFTIQAAVTYDMPALSAWPNGSNSHGETLATTQQQYVYKAPTLTANFAISNDNNVPASFTGPYTLQTPQIVATNEDLLAWYCWTPGDAPDGQADGGYYVPAWKSGFTFNGTSWVDTLDFTVDGGGLIPTDPRAINIESSYGNGYDIFTSQSSALKIANWESSLNLDPGVLYANADDAIPSNVAINGDFSDVSVFVPEPATIGMVGLLMFGLGLRRRTAK